MSPSPSLLPPLGPEEGPGERTFPILTLTKVATGTQSLGHILV